VRLRQIEIFHAVYANGSISSAARALNVSQPAVSKVLRHTESQLGIRLFDLVRGRLVPTDEAHALFREVDEVFHRVTSLQQTANNLRNSGAGHLRIGIVPSLGLEVLPQVIAIFARAIPKSRSISKPSTTATCCVRSTSANAILLLVMIPRSIPA